MWGPGSGIKSSVFVLNSHSDLSRDCAFDFRWEDKSLLDFDPLALEVDFNFVLRTVR